MSAGAASDRGGGIYWGRKEVSDSKGIAVIFAWVSIPERHLKSYVNLYASLGWNSLVCHAHFLHAFYPERAMSSAFDILNELVEELRIKPCPVVFVGLSAGTKACMYKVFQIIEGISEGQLYPGEYRLVRKCITGHIYDSGPVDFTTDLGTHYALHPTILKMPGSSKLVSWVAKGIASGLDALYLTRFESQWAEYWQASVWSQTQTQHIPHVIFIEHPSPPKPATAFSAQIRPKPQSFSHKYAVLLRLCSGLGAQSLLNGLEERGNQNQRWRVRLLRLRGRHSRHA